MNWMSDVCHWTSQPTNCVTSKERNPNGCEGTGLVILAQDSEKVITYTSQTAKRRQRGRSRRGLKVTWASGGWWFRCSPPCSAGIW